MIDAEPAMLAAHADDLVDHVELVLGDLRTCILLADHLRNVLIPGLLDVEERLCRGPTQLLRLLLLKVIVNNLVRLHVTVEILRHNVV